MNPVADHLRAAQALINTPDRDADGQRLYNLLAFFDTRDGTLMARLVQSAREGWERSHPDMAETGAWDEFDAHWANREWIHTKGPTP